MSVSILELKKALTTLEDSLKLFSNSIIDSNENKAFRDASIQRFEYCVELSWKVSIKSLGLKTDAARPAIRDMARNGFIENINLWFEFVDARNNSSHSYDEKTAISVFQVAQKLPLEAHKLIKILELQ